MEAICNQDIDIEKWQHFVHDHKHGNFFQSFEFYTLFSNCSPYSAIGIVAIDDDRIVGVMTASIIKQHSGILGFFSSRSIIAGGPLLLNEGSQEVIDLLFAKYFELIKGKALYTQVRNLFDLHLSDHICKKHNIVYTEHLNFIIDMTLPVDILWGNLSTKKRNLIKQGTKEELIIKKLTTKNELQDAYSLLTELYKKIKLPLPPYSFFEKAKETMNGAVLTVYGLYDKSNDLLSVNYIIGYNNTSFLWYSSTAAKEKIRNFNHWFLWNVILIEKEQGAVRFDMGGAGSPHEDYGVGKFKKRFAGKEVNYGRFQIIHNKFIFTFSKIAFSIWRIFK